MGVTVTPMAPDPSTALIARLRKVTKADLAECRAALEASRGDVERAILRIRDRQIESLVERSRKEASECQQALMDAEGDTERALARLMTADAGALDRQRVAEILASDTPAEERLESLLTLIWRRDLHDMTPVENTVALVGMLRNALVFGGFQQYFFTIGHRVLAETVHALQTVGADRTALLLHEAARVTRGERTDVTLEALDAVLAEDPEPLADLAVAWVQQHRDQFAV